jgi:hypothetical protein
VVGVFRCLGCRGASSAHALYLRCLHTSPRYEPWRDITQYELDCCTKVRQPMAAAIEHYGRSYPNGKPPYRLEVQEEDKDLFTIKNWAPKVTTPDPRSLPWTHGWVCTNVHV